MGEYIPASIKFGGKLAAEHAAELVELLNDKHLTPDWGCGGPVTREDLRTESFFGNSEVNYGNLDEITSFAAQHGLSYVYECDSGPEWDAATEVYDAVADKTSDFIGQQDLAITLRKVKELGSYEAVLAYFEKPKQLPAFEIIGEFPADD